MIMPLKQEIRGYTVLAGLLFLQSAAAHELDSITRSAPQSSVTAEKVTAEIQGPGNGPGKLPAPAMDRKDFIRAIVGDTEDVLVHERSAQRSIGVTGQRADARALAAQCIVRATQ